MGALAGQNNKFYSGDVEFCPYYERGFCHKGAQNCRFDHFSKFLNQNFMHTPTD